MREIKFRGKLKEHFGDKNGNVVLQKGTWVYGGIVFDENRVWIDTKYHGEIIVDKDTIGQYTGLKDKNGKEIYEGDIVRDMEVYLTHQLYVKQEIESVQEAEKYRYFGNVAVVEFCTQEIASCGCCYQEFVGTGFKAKRVDLTCCEVIGNIYDNPELLEKGKE